MQRAEASWAEKRLLDSPTDWCVAHASGIRYNHDAAQRFTMLAEMHSGFPPRRANGSGFLALSTQFAGENMT